MAIRLSSVTSNGDRMDHTWTADNEQEKEKELVVVTWVDILQTADWTPAEDVTIPTMQSVGWFISRDEREIKIGSTRVVQSADDLPSNLFWKSMGWMKVATRMGISHKNIWKQTSKRKVNIYKFDPQDMFLN